LFQNKFWGFRSYFSCHGNRYTTIQWIIKTFKDFPFRIYMEYIINKWQENAVISIWKFNCFQGNIYICFQFPPILNISSYFYLCLNVWTKITKML
jgi:hypothetical protein